MDSFEEKLMNELLPQLDLVEYIHAEDIPKIPLYMDQLTTFMEEYLSHGKRFEEDKVLTKTMINNYAKSKVLPAPEKKKYSSEHMITLIFIYYLKNFLSIGDIQAVLQPVLSKHFASAKASDMMEIYETFVTICRKELPLMREDMEHKIRLACENFSEESPEDQEMLRRFALVALLSFDVYEKKRMIEQLIDGYFVPENERREEKAKKEKKK